MMQVYYMRVSWVSGIACFAAFLLTFWPSRHRMTTAAVLWVIGMLSITGLTAYGQFMQGGISYAFSSPSSSFPLFAWLIPLLSVALAVAESVLLFTWIEQALALRIGKILFLVVVPAYLLLASLPYARMGFWQFPVGITWLGFPLLWFRIRENYK